MQVLNIMLGEGKGGLEVAAINYTRLLESAGHNVTTFLGAASPYIKELQEEGLQKKSFSFFLKCPFLGKIFLKRFLKKENPDVVLFHGRRSLRHFKKILPRGVISVGVVHNDRFEDFLCLDGVFCPTKTLRKKVLSKNAQIKTYYIPNFLIEEKEEEANPLPQRIPRDGKDLPCIGFLGRLSPVKGAEVFLKALSILFQKNIPFTAQVGGDGPEKEHLKTMAASLGIKEKVAFLGWVQDKASFFETIDVFCLTSKSEAFGLVLLEAMRYGVPIISTRTEGPSEVIEEGLTGKMVGIDDPRALAEVLQQLLEESLLCKQLSQNAFIRYKENYTKAIALRFLKEALLALTESRRGG